MTLGYIQRIAATSITGHINVCVCVFFVLYLSVYLSVCLPPSLSPVSVSVCQPVCQPGWLGSRLPVCPSACLCVSVQL